jgi:hypothetical protein
MYKGYAISKVILQIVCIMNKRGKHKINGKGVGPGMMGGGVLV